MQRSNSKFSINISVDDINAILPQTQCTKCGYDGCKPYATAIYTGEANINQCPPGGQAGINQLAKLLGREPITLNPENGIEQPRKLAIIDETHCIGCTLCIQACPVDAIMGANKLMHTIIPDLCTGCDLCIPACPVDCIDMISPEPPLARWQESDKQAAKQRFEKRTLRLETRKQENDQRLAQKAQEKLSHLNQVLENTNSADEQAALKRKQSIVEAAIARARAKQQGS